MIITTECINTTEVHLAQKNCISFWDGTSPSPLCTLCSINFEKSQCFKDDNASQWKSGKFDPAPSKKPLNRSSPKFAWVITSATPTTMRNLIMIRLSPFASLPQICENAHQVYRLVLLVLPTAYSQDPCTYFHVQYVKWRGFAQGCAFWGFRKQNFTFGPNFPPKAQFFCQFSTGLKISRQKGLNKGDAPL